MINIFPFNAGTSWYKEKAKQLEKATKEMKNANPVKKAEMQIELVLQLRKKIPAATIENWMPWWANL